MKNRIILSITFIIWALSLQAQSPNKKPKNIIFLIGDGMGLSQISYPIMQDGLRLNIERFVDIGLMNTSSSNNRITDSAAGATAFSIGKKTQNGSIGVDSNDVPQETILESASKRGLSTGLIATCAITHATPASFIAHQDNRNKTEAIAMDFLKTPVDLFVGGGLNNFDKRKDGLKLTDSLLSRGYSVYKNENDFLNAPLIGKTAAFIANNHPPSMSDGRGGIEAKAVQKGIDLLKQNKNGFFLMVEGSQIDWGGHANDANYIKEELLDFDKVVKLVLDFAEKDGNTLVVLTADHETGGFALTANPNDDSDEGGIKPAFTSKGHSASLVPVFAYGPGSAMFRGFIDNTDIYQKFKLLLKL